MSEFIYEKVMYDPSASLPDESQSASISFEVRRNIPLKNAQTILGIIAANQRAIMHCDDCTGKRHSNIYGGSQCAREALLPSIGENVSIASSTLRACISCSEIIRQGGKMPVHGIGPNHS